MRILKLTLTYDGTRFVGWQRQADGESIQGLIEEALAPIEGAAVTVHGAGRTDAGVHALGQVASVRVACTHDTATLTRALNARLPADVRILAIDEQRDDFHARYSARSKCYRYQMQTSPIVGPFEHRYVWHLPQPLDVAAMREAAAAIIGTHDFAAFQSAGSAVRDTVRTVTRSALVDGALLTYEICGSGFLRHMVRAIVGTLVEVGEGRRTVPDAAALIERRTRADAGRTAPPHGLFLVGVVYD